MEARLKTGLWVKALIRRCDLAAIGVAVVARGDPDSGAVLLKFNGREAGCRMLAQARGPDAPSGGGCRVRYESDQWSWP